MIDHLEFQNIWSSLNCVLGQLKYICQIKDDIDVYCGKDFDRLPFLALKGTCFIPTRSEKIGKLAITKRQGSSALDVYVIITLKDPSLTDFFAVFLSALLSEIEASDEDPGDVLVTYCKEWEILFHDPQQSEKAIGLLGELFFLHLLNDSKLTQFSWNGGHNSPQDFALEPGNFIEIKTTTNHSEYNVHIHGIGQLDFSFPDTLWLIFVRMIRVEKGSWSIEKLLKIIPSELIPNTVSKEIQQLPKELRTVEFNCKECNAYPVNELFPRLTRESLKDVPGTSSIVNVVDYIINLQTLESIPVASFLREHGGIANE